MPGKKKQKLEISADKPEAESLLGSDWMGNNESEGQLLLDVFQDENNIYIKSTIAGVKIEDLDISIHNDMLTIRGSRSHEHEIDEKEYFFQECYWGGFSRSIILPTEVQSDKISATLKSGVLTVTLPKAKQRRNIPIEISQ